MLSGATAAGQTGKGKDSTFPLQILLLLNQNSKKKLNKNSAYQQQLQQEQRSAGFCPDTARSIIMIQNAPFSSRMGPEVSGWRPGITRERKKLWLESKTSPLVTLGPCL